MAAKGKRWKLLFMFIITIFILFGIIVFYLKHKLGQLECAATNKTPFTLQRYIVTLKTFLFGASHSSNNDSLLCTENLNEVCMHILIHQLPTDTKYYLIDFWGREPELREFVFRIFSVVALVALIIYCNLCRWMTANELHYAEDYEEKTIKANIMKALGDKCSKQLKLNSFATPSHRGNSKLSCPENSSRFPSPGEYCCQAWNLNLWKIIAIVVALFTIVSIPWEFVRLYQKEVSKRAASASIGSPYECFPRDMTVAQGIKSWAQKHFSWDHHDDPCEKYYYTLLVDPLWELTPLMVLSSALTRCILHPIEQLFSGLGRSCRMFFSEIPAQWQPVVMTLLLLLGLVLLLMLFGYRLSVPLLFKMEPKTPDSQRTAKSQACCGHGHLQSDHHGSDSLSHGDYLGHREYLGQGECSEHRGPVNRLSLRSRARKIPL